MIKIKLVKNKAQCKLCLDIIESKHRHDFNFCSCSNLAVDGGYDYIKRSYDDPETIIELSEYESYEVNSDDEDWEDEDD